MNNSLSHCVRREKWRLGTAIVLQSLLMKPLPASSKDLMSVSSISLVLIIISHCISCVNATQFKRMYLGVWAVILGI